MVKARVSRSLAHRFNPLAEPEGELSEPDLIVRLRSPDDSEREIACVSAGTLRTSSDPDPVLKVLIERISDPNAQVRLAAFQACDSLAELYSQNLIAAGVTNLIEFELSKYFTMEATLYESEVERQTAVMIATAALDLLSTLCEYSTTLLSRMTTTVFISHILAHLTTSSHRHFLITPCMGLLQVLSEDNHSFLTCAPADFPTVLITIGRELQAGQMREQSGVATVLCNYFLLKDDSEAIKSVIVPTILRLTDHQLWTEFIDSVLPNLKEATNKAVSVWRDASVAVEEALQLTANLLYTDNEDEASEFFASLVSRNSVESVMKLACGLPIDTIVQLSDVFAESVQSTVLSIQCTAINVLKNVILSGARFMGSDEAATVCVRFYELCSAWFANREEAMAKESVDLLLSGALSLMQICAKRLNLPLPVEWVELLLGLCAMQNVEIATSAVGLVSCLNRTQHSMEVNGKVCACLLSCCRSKSLPLVNEALNAFFDIYSEENYDSVLLAQGVVPLMEEGLPIFNEMVKKEQSEDLKENAELTATNLRDFIAYKREHMQ